LETCLSERLDVVLQGDGGQRVDRRRDCAQRGREYSGDEEAGQTYNDSTFRQTVKTKIKPYHLLSCEVLISEEDDEPRGPM